MSLPSFLKRKMGGTSTKTTVILEQPEETKQQQEEEVSKDNSYKRKKSFAPPPPIENETPKKQKKLPPIPIMSPLTQITKLYHEKQSEMIDDEPEYLKEETNMDVSHYYCEEAFDNDDNKETDEDNHCCNDRNCKKCFKN